MTDQSNSTNQLRMQRMHTLLTTALAPSALEIIDDSHLHAGHAGAKTGLGHFTVKIVSAAFAQKRALICHRMVYDALGDMMSTDIHALSISAKAE